VEETQQQAVTKYNLQCSHLTQTMKTVFKDTYHKNRDEKPTISNGFKEHQDVSFM